MLRPEIWPRAAGTHQDSQSLLIGRRIRSCRCCATASCRAHHCAAASVAAFCLRDVDVSNRFRLRVPMRCRRSTHRSRRRSCCMSHHAYVKQLREFVHAAIAKQKVSTCASSMSNRQFNMSMSMSIMSIMSMPTAWSTRCHQPQAPSGALRRPQAPSGALRRPQGKGHSERKNGKNMASPLLHLAVISRCRPVKAARAVQPGT